MTVTTPTPPHYIFALFGRRRSGKTVFLSALAALRLPSAGIGAISYIRALPPIFSDDTEPLDETERQRVEDLCREATEAINAKRVPRQTEVSDGFMGHRFEVVLPEPPFPGASSIIYIDIYDFAGERIDPSAADQVGEANLHHLLRDTDGLLILAETPSPGVDAAEHLTSLAGVVALGEALARLGQAKDAAIRQAVLLATKWDHQQPFTLTRQIGESIDDFQIRRAEEENRHRHQFDTWLKTAPAAEQHHTLDVRLKAIYHENYRAYPVSAFGVATFVDIEASDGKPAEVPAKVPLAALNLVEPLLFLVERARANHRQSLLARAAQQVGATDNVPEETEIRGEFGDDAELLALRDDLATRKAVALAAQVATQAQEAQRKRRRKLGLATAIITALAVGGVAVEAKFSLDRQTAIRDDIAAALAGRNLDAVIAARQDLLAQVAHKPLSPPLVLLGLDYSADEQKRDLANLETAECELWGERAQPVFDLAKAEARIRFLPNCTELESRIKDARPAIWRQELRGRMDAFRSLTAPKNCEAETFVVSAVAERRNELFVLLDQAPPGTGNEAMQARSDVTSLGAVCIAAADQAEKDRQTGRDKEARDLELEKQDEGTLDQQRWADYVQGLLAFRDKEGSTTAADLTIRKALVQERLTRLPGQLEDWQKTLNGSMQQGQSNMPYRIDSLRSLKLGVNALPAEFTKQKDALLDRIGLIERDFAQWSACSRLKDVLAIYDEVSSKLTSRTEKRLGDLRQALHGAMTDQAVNDLVGAALKQIDGQIKAISIVTVSSFNLTGVLPGQSNRKTSGTWSLGSGRGTFEASMKGDGKFDIVDSPDLSLGASTLDFFLSAEQDTFGRNPFFATKVPFGKDDLLAGKIGSSLGKVKVVYQIPLHQFDKTTVSTSYNPNSSSEKSSVTLTLTLTGDPGAAISRGACP